MNKFFFLFFLLFYNVTVGQLIIDNTTVTPSQLVQSVLLGTGINATNITFNGLASNATMSRDQVGHFTNGNTTNIGLTEGIIICTGDASVAIGPNNSPDATLTTIFPVLGDPDLFLISAPDLIQTKAVLEFDFIATGNIMKFDFVFASEEYLEYVNAGFNDVFGFFISGPGISGPYSNNSKNIALIPLTTIPISIDSVNDSSNPFYYTDNGDGITVDPSSTIQFDGFTKVIKTEATLQIGETYHIKLAIANVGDDALDSAVFLKARSFNIITPTQPVVSVNNSTICIGQTATVTATPSVAGVYTYTWTVPFGFVNPGNVASFTTNVAGNYTVIISDPNATPTSSLPATGLVSINLLPEVSVVVNNPTACTDNFATVIASPVIIGSYSYLWEGPSNFSNPGNVASFTTTVSGDYCVTITNTNTSCVSTQSCGLVAINAIPQTPVISADSSVCENESIHLYATTISNATYVWSGPNGFTSTQQNPIIPNAVLQNTGTYTVYATNNLCNSATSSVAVVINPAIDFEVFQGCYQNKRKVEAVATNNSFQTTDVVYSWTGPNGFTSSQNPPSITVQGNYSVTVANSLSGCSKTLNFDVINVAFNIPRGVSPNDDGKNDTFNLKGLCVKDVAILNRYGIKVFEKQNYEEEWHGQDFNEAMLPSGTYYYQIKFEDGETKTGWVYLATEGN